MTQQTDTPTLIAALQHAVSRARTKEDSMACLEAADRLEQLQAVVDKLPKTADGLYADMGQAVYYVNRGPRGGVKILDYRLGWDEIDGKVMAGLYWHGRDQCDEYVSFVGEAEVSECYSTESAARQAAALAANAGEQ